MTAGDVPDELVRLVEKMRNEYTKSEYEIALVLAQADGPLSIDTIADETGYTERTIKKRVGTLEEALGGEPLIRRDDEGRPTLHHALSRALREIPAE